MCTRIRTRGLLLTGQMRYRCAMVYCSYHPQRRKHTISSNWFYIPAILNNFSVCFLGESHSWKMSPQLSWTFLRSVPSIMENVLVAISFFFRQVKYLKVMRRARDFWLWAVLMSPNRTKHYSDDVCRFEKCSTIMYFSSSVVHLTHDNAETAEYTRSHCPSGFSGLLLERFCFTWNSAKSREEKVSGYESTASRVFALKIYACCRVSTWWPT